MTNIDILIAAAKTIKVSAVLLVAICSHESHGLKNVITLYDAGSPSFGMCQLKKSAANFVGYSGDPNQLVNPYLNAIYSARYLKYQLDRYDGNWVKATAAYNAGSYKESSESPGNPKNLRYVKLVQKQLDEANKFRLAYYQ